MTDEQIEALRIKYGKIGVVEFNSHTFVFRKPSRDEARDYRRKRESESEKVDAVEQLAQVTLVALDNVSDVNVARTHFTTVFLEEFPLAASHPKFGACLSALAGLIEEEDQKDLGKGVSIKGANRSPSPTA